MTSRGMVAADLAILPIEFHMHSRLEAKSIRQAPREGSGPAKKQNLIPTL